MWNPFIEAIYRAFTRHFCIGGTFGPLGELDEHFQDALVALEVNKRRIKVQYDKSVCPRKFSEGDLVILWDQAKKTLGAGKFNPIWHGPYIVKCVLEKGTYELVYYEGTALVEPRNGLYLKKYYAWFSARADYCILLYSILHN